MSSDGRYTRPSAEEGFTLISALPDRDQSGSNSDHPQDDRRERRPSSVLPIARIRRPILLIVVALLDLVTNHAFFLILDRSSTSPASPSESSASRHTSIVRLLFLGYTRSIFILVLALRRDWPARGRLYMTIAFVITGLAVLWEINLSVLYRGWGEGQGKDMVAFAISKGKGKAIYLFLQMTFTSLEYISYALSLHWATRQGRYLPSVLARSRQRATSIRFEEEDVFLDRPAERAAVTEDGYLAPRTFARDTDQATGEEEEYLSDSSRGSHGDDGEEDADELDLAFLAGSDSDDTDEDEIIDLPLPIEARIERKTSQMSLRRRMRVDETQELLAGSSQARAGQVEVEENDEGRGGVWESVRGILGITNGREGQRKRLREGYGTI